MNRRDEQSPTGSLSHEACRELLPWYANRTLDDSEQRGVEAHLEACDACREELGSIEELQAAIREQPQPQDEALEPPVVAPSPAITPARSGRTLRWVVLAQAAAIVLLALALFRPAGDEPPEFVLRSDAQPAETSGTPTYRVVFTESITQNELRELLHSLGAEIVAGPTSVGAYTVRTLETTERPDALAALRNSPLVRLAEPIGESTGP